jgi:hypothetical protein
MAKKLGVSYKIRKKTLLYLVVNSSSAARRRGDLPETTTTKTWENRWDSEVIPKWTVSLIKIVKEDERTFASCWLEYIDNSGPPVHSRRTKNFLCQACFVEYFCKIGVKWDKEDTESNYTKETISCQPMTVFLGNCWGKIFLSYELSLVWYHFYLITTLPFVSYTCIPFTWRWRSKVFHLQTTKRSDFNVNPRWTNNFHIIHLLLFISLIVLFEDWYLLLNQCED